MFDIEGSRQEPIYKRRQEVLFAWRRQFRSFTGKDVPP